MAASIRPCLRAALHREDGALVLSGDGLLYQLIQHGLQVAAVVGDQFRTEGSGGVQ